MTRLRIVLVDDHGVVREGLKRLLEAQPDFELVGEASSGQEAVALIAALKPDLAMMDLSMPDLSGIDATTKVQEASPATRILALTVHEDDAYVRAFLKAGARGYLLKRSSTEELIRAIREVGAGGIYVDPRVSKALITGMLQLDQAKGRIAGELSEREAEVLRLIALGYANKEIAAQLNLSIKTIETYKARSMEKLGLKDRVGIVRVASERGWLKT